VVELVAVGVEDRLPVGLAVEVLGDLREVVAAGDGIGLLAGSAAAAPGDLLGRGDLGLHVGEIGPGLLGALHAALDVGEIGLLVVAHSGTPSRVRAGATLACAS